MYEGEVCFPLPGGFYSGDIKASLSNDTLISSTAFHVTINDTEPIYLYDGIITAKEAQLLLLIPSPRKILAIMWQLVLRLRTLFTLLVRSLEVNLLLFPEF